MKFGSIEIGGKLGGYEVVNVPADKLPQDLESAVGNINSKLGATFNPIWYWGKQTVNGVNHLLICEEIRSTKDRNVGIVGVVINIPPNSVGGEGAKVEEVIEEAKLSPEVEIAFKAAEKQLSGVGYKPIIFVGEQTVKGKNYYFICQAQEIYKVTTKPVAVLLCVNAFENNYIVKGVAPLPINTKETICGYAFTW